jgi:HSP20 family protein
MLKVSPERGEHEGGAAMAISRWEPAGGALSLRDAFSQLFDQSVWAPMGQSGGFGGQVPLDVYTEGDRYVIEAALPGLDPDAISIEMVQGTLTISGAYPEVPAEGRHYLIRQWPRGHFQAAVTLPDAGDAGAIDATYEHGLLRLSVPKSEAAKPKRIALKSGT